MGMSSSTYRVTRRALLVLAMRKVEGDFTGGRRWQHELAELRARYYN